MSKFILGFFRYSFCYFLILFYSSIFGQRSIDVQAQNVTTPALHKLQIAEFAISNLYVDKVDEDKLVEEGITQMLSGLDPHSTYSNAEEVKKMNAPLLGNFEGIGVLFNIMEDTVLVIQTITNGPSERAGILAGDRIISVNDTTIAGVQMSSEAIMSRLRGEKGTKVNLRIVRRGASESLWFTVTRDKIPVFSLDAFYMVQPQIGYIRIEHFGATTADEFKEALTKLQKAGMKDMILDLQGNGGGYLNASIDLADEFLSRKELIVYTEGRASKRKEFFAQGSGKFRKGRLVILVDEYSASASEIVSGAVQDWDRGMIVGRRSFGKGLVQRPINLPDGSMIRLTVARYYTPAGRCIQKPYGNAEQYQKDILNRYNNGEMINADSIHFFNLLKYKTKKLGRTVYGSGGIMPDCFVPVDTTLYTNYYRKLRDKGIIIKTATRYMDNNRNELLKKYKKFETFNDHFYVDEINLLIEMKELASKEKIEFHEKEYSISLSLIKTQLKAFISRDIWGTNEYYRVINTINPNVIRAIELLKSGEYEEILHNM